MKRLIFLTALATMMVTSLGMAQPPMGAPEEMKALHSAAGEYDMEFSFKMAPDAEWTVSQGTAILTNILDGSAQRMDMETNMMGMPFKGLGIVTYSRIHKQWQQTWTDNMGAQTTMYTGKMEDGKMVFHGEDMGPDGSTMKVRLTTYNMTDNSMDWMMEAKMTGSDEYMKMAKATYVRKGSAEKEKKAKKEKEDDGGW